MQIEMREDIPRKDSKNVKKCNMFLSAIKLSALLANLIGIPIEKPW
jgi:hypothetical protein